MVFRRRKGTIDVFLVHPGGPFWAGKDKGAWSIPKGEYSEEEDPLHAAKREFFEETHLEISGPFRPLTPVKQAGGKVVAAWAVEGDLDASAVESNPFTLEWPPRSGREQSFPEVDRAEWFPLAAAREKILKGQAALLDELEEIVERG